MKTEPIDIHTHMFNLKYLPIAGIIQSRLGIVSKLFGLKTYILAKGVEKILIWNTKGFSTKPAEPLAVREPTLFDVLFGGDAAIQQIKPSNDNRSLFELNESELMGSLLHVPRSIVDEKEVLDALDEFDKIDKDDPVLKSLETAYLLEIKFNDLGTGKESKFLKVLLWVFRKIQDGIDYLRWFVFMTKSEEDIFKTIKEAHKNKVQKFVHIMMDVDGFFGKSAPYYSLEKRIERMQSLTNNHADKLIGFIAFNPKKEKSLKIIQNAIEKKGFKGVKVYPPLGYQPIGNKEKDYDGRLLKLYEYCVEEKVPILAHCNNKGFEAIPSKHSGYKSNPKHWEKVLGQFSDLRLCLGHGGGNEGWFAPIQDSDHLSAKLIEYEDIQNDSDGQSKNWNDSYAAMVFKLCVEYNNVYCDLSYLDDFIKRKGGKDKTKMGIFKDRLVELIKSEPTFAKKIMYGSDWHMLYKDAKEEVYFDEYWNFFSDGIFDPYRDDIFQHNAERYLSLERPLLA